MWELAPIASVNSDSFAGLLGLIDRSKDFVPTQA